MAISNNDILNEAFWNKKKTYTEKRDEKRAQYAPVKNSDNTLNLFNGKTEDGFIISDIDEVKKRITGALAMAMGSNTVRSMANKAVKSFPIIVSDDIAPETVVIIKSMMEEQYASYIDLLVSNQIINLSDYNTDGTEGNIAIQALNKLDGNDFSAGRLARQAQTGSLSIDDIMRNNPGWQFLKTNENAEYTSGNAILDTLFENAIVVPSEYANVTATALYEDLINEAKITASTNMIYSGYLGAGVTAQNITDDVIKVAIRDLIKKNKNSWDIEFVPGTKFCDMSTNNVYERQSNGTWELKSTGRDDGSAPSRRLGDYFETLRSTDRNDLYSKYKYAYDDNDNAIYDKLISPRIIADDKVLDKSLDRCVAEIISSADKKGSEKELADYIRDRFEKATFLLTGRLISGGEYVSYVRDRLMLPVSSATAQSIIVKFPTKQLDFKNAPNDGELVNQLRTNISKNEMTVLTKYVPTLLQLTGKDLAIIGAGTTGGGLVGAGISAALALSMPVVGIAVSAAVGGLSAAILRIIKKNKEKRAAYANVTGWQRVELLIDEMDYNKKDLYKHKDDIDIKNLSDDEKIAKFTSEQDDLFANFSKKMARVYDNVEKNASRIKNYTPYQENITEESVQLRLNFAQELDEELKADEDFYSDFVVMDEAAKYTISVRSPKQIQVKPTKLNTKEIASIVPSFGAKDVMAYGSVEFDKRDIKDRKFNEPLILTIKFKERYSDGKYSDNELTAVIGILGVVTRVPSQEMAYILKSNAEGKTLKDIFTPEEGNNNKDLIANVLTSFMKSKYAEKLPTSGKVWANLEKVSALAIANKLAGNNNGNVSNAHLVFSQREIDEVKNELGIDYLKNTKLTAQLMKKYSAFMIAVCNDVMQYLYTFNDPDAISWDDAPYSAYMGKSNSDQLLSAFTQYNRMKL